MRLLVCIISLSFVIQSISFKRFHLNSKSTIRVVGKYTSNREIALLTAKGNNETPKEEAKGKSNPFEAVASAGLAGILAIAVAEAFFWAAGIPVANLYFKLTEGEWLDLSQTEDQIKAGAFSVGYGGFATAVLQYRVTIAAIPLIPIMEKYVVTPGKKYFGENFGSKKE